MITSSQIARLEKLAELRDKGALTSEEFEQHKQALLSSEPPKSVGTVSSSTLKKKLVGDVDLGELETHLRWMVLPLQKYANFTDRSGRREYWMFSLGMAIAYLVLGAIFSSALQSDDSVTGMFSLIIMGIISLVLFVPTLAVQVRRFHDLDKPGAFVLLNLIPYVGWAIVLVFMCLQGTDGPNRFGDDPSKI